jgi:hypothetical protein
MRSHNSISKEKKQRSETPWQVLETGGDSAEEGDTATHSTRRAQSDYRVRSGYRRTQIERWRDGEVRSGTSEKREL